MRRASKLAAGVVAGLLLLLAILAGVVLIGGNTDAGRSVIESLTNRLTAGRVKLAGLSGSFPAQLTLRQLQLSDDRGVWLTAHDVALRWTPLAYFTHGVQVESLQVARLQIERAPVSAATSHGDTRIPHIEVAQFSIGVLELSSQLAGAPTSLSARGSVQLRWLQDGIAELVAHRINGEGDYELHLRFDPSRMDARLQLHEPASGPLENLLQLPGLGALSVTMTLTGPRRSERVDLAVDAGELHGRAGGSLDLEHRSADLEYSLAAPAMAPRPDVAWQRIALQGRWRGGLVTPVTDGRLHVDRLQLAGGIAIGALDATYDGSAGRIALHARVAGLQTPGPQAALLRQNPIAVEASIRLNEATRPLQLSATHPLFSLQAQVVTAGVPGAKFELHLPDVAPLAAIAAQEARGEASITGEFTWRGAASQLTLNARAAFAPGGAPWTAALGDRATLQLSAALNDDTITVSRLRLTGRAGSASLTGSASRTTARVPHGAAVARGWINDLIQDLRAHWELNITDLAAVSGALAGTLAASGEISGAPTALNAAAKLTSSLSVRGSPVGKISAEVQGRGLPTAPNGSLQAQGILDGAPLGLDVVVDRTGNGSVRAQIRRADWKSLHIEGDATSRAALADASGALRVQCGELSDLNRLLGLNLAGSVTGEVAFKPASGRAHMQVRLEAHDVVAGFLKANALLHGEGPLDAMDLQLTVQVPNLHGAGASLASKAVLNVAADELRIASAAAEYRGQTVRLLVPAQIDFANGISVSQLRLGAHEAELQLGGRLSPALDVRASLRQLKPSLVNVWVPGLLAEGTISADAELQGSAAAPTGHMRLDASGLRSASEAASGLPAVELHGTARLTGNAAIIDARLSAGNASSLTASGAAPLNIDGDVDFKVSGKLDVGLVNPLLEARGQHAAGEITIDATVSGTASAPKIDGTIHLAHGSARDYARGVNLSDMTGEFVGNEAMLQIKSFSARASSGNVSMTGTIGVLQPGLPVDVRLTAKDAEPIVSKILTANLNADLHLSGKARERLDFAGNVYVNRATIDIPSSLPPNVAVLDVRRRGQEPPPAPERPLIIALDLTVQAPQQILVKGRGLDAELGGDLHVGGTSAEALVSGGFDLKRGSFTLASSKLNFTTGRVSFDSAGLKKQIDPTLDFTAQTTVADVTATLRITGLADAPKFEFTSVPSLPQDEIMARLLFGEPAAQLSAFQVAEIAAALANLSGVGGNGGLNPLIKIQKGLGLDRLSVGAATTTTATGATTNAGAQIQAGRYVSKRVYVEAKQTTTGSTQVQVDVDLAKHLKLQTRLGNGTTITQGTTPENDPGSSIGLQYQFEY